MSEMSRTGRKSINNQSIDLTDSILTDSIPRQKVDSFDNIHITESNIDNGWYAGYDDGMIWKQRSQVERSNLGVKVMFKCMKGGSFQRLMEEVVAGLNSGKYV